MGGVLITIRLLELNELSIIDNWYKQREWPPINRDLLPFNDGKPSAYVLEDDGVLCYCCWLYESNANLVVLDWVVSNPQKDTSYDLHYFLKEVVDIVKNEYKVKFICSLFDENVALKKVFDKMGFVAGSQCTNYFKEL